MYILPLLPPPNPGEPRSFAINYALIEHARGWFVRFICLDCHIFHSSHISHAHTYPTLIPLAHALLYPNTEIEPPNYPSTHRHTHILNTQLRFSVLSLLLRTGPTGKGATYGVERSSTPPPDQFRQKNFPVSVSRAAKYAVMKPTTAQP